MQKFSFARKKSSFPLVFLEFLPTICGWFFVPNTEQNNKFIVQIESKVVNLPFFHLLLPFFLFSEINSIFVAFRRFSVGKR